LVSDSHLNVSSHREVTRLPRVRRIAYLRALLAVAGKGECTKDQAREAVLEVVKSLDAAKAAALGRRVPKPPKADQLVEQCIQMTTRLGLLERRGSSLRSTPSGTTLLNRDGNDLQLYFQLLYLTFPLFRILVTSICERSEGYLVPQSRYGGLFAREAREQGLELDQMTFEVVRDLATDLFVLNWRPSPISKDGVDYLNVYAVGKARTKADRFGEAFTDETAIQDSATNGSGYIAPVYAVNEASNEEWVFVGNVVAIQDFEQALWRHYLRLTDQVPRFPVLYPDLRDAVCETLRIPDSHFDASIKELMRRPYRLEIYPAEGVLDYSSKAAITYKHVPPRTTAGQFMTFLKIDLKAA